MIREGVEKLEEKPASCSTNGGRNPLNVGCEHQMNTTRRGNSIQNEALLEVVLERGNMITAYERVVENKGAPGVDGITTAALKAYLDSHWQRIKEEMLMGNYKPQPVRQVEIPKPDGGMRKLGIPTVIDRLIQQALHQVLSPLFDPHFSEFSYGFRPGRSAHQATKQAREYIAEGRRWVVDIDLEKFFDRVNHDILMSRLARRIKDKRILRLVRRFLQSGIMIGGLETARTEGTPQGGPLSPLLSNILLDELDKELESRGHKFCRYADDCNIYVRSQLAGERVMKSLKDYLEKKLKLKVNEEKSKVGRPWKRKFLGFSVTSEKKTRIRIAEKAIKRVKDKVRERLKSGRGKSLEETIQGLRVYLKGWINYFKLTETVSILEELDGWIRRKLRKIIWEQMKSPWTRTRELMNRGIGEEMARKTAWSRKGAWRNSHTQAMCIAYPNQYFEGMGLISLFRERQKFK